MESKPINTGGQIVYTSDIKTRNVPYVSQTFKQKKSYVVRGKKFYSKLVKSNSSYYRGLYDDYSKESIVGHLLICYTRKFDNDIDYMYGLYESYVEFYEYYKQFSVNDRCFYEIINYYQKPHFDIDIKCKKIMEVYLFEKSYNENESYIECKKIADYLVETVIRSCQLTMLPNELSLENDVLIYTSHNQEKLSYHIILDHWSHFDNIEAKAFYDKVSRLTQCLLNGKYCEFLDDRVYSENQAFRLVGSHKADNNRVKTFQPQFMYNGNLIIHKNNENEKLINLHNFSQSLVTFTSGCKLLQSFKVDRIYKMTYQCDITEADVKEITTLLHSKFKYEFIMRDVRKNKIELSKKRPYFCKLCERVHQHENPRIIVLSGCVYWQCRRTFAKMELGYLTSYDKDKKEIIEDEVDDYTGNFLSFGDFKIDLTVDNDDEVYRFDDENENKNKNIENKKSENKIINQKIENKIINQKVENKIINNIEKIENKIINIEKIENKIIYENKSEKVENIIEKKEIENVIGKNTVMHNLSAMKNKNSSCRKTPRKRDATDFSSIQNNISWG